MANTESENSPGKSGILLNFCALFTIGSAVGQGEMFPVQFRTISLVGLDVVNNQLGYDDNLMVSELTMLNEDWLC